MRRRVYVAAGVIAVLAAGGCSHGSSSGGSSDGALRAAPQAHGNAAPNAASRAGGGVAVDAADGKSGQRLATRLDDGAYKIRTAQITVAVQGASNVADRADRAITIAKRAGGDVDSDDRTSGPHATATLQLRVPPDALQDTLHALSELGTEKVRTSSTTDVTQRVADVGSRVQSAQQAIAALRALYAQTHRIPELIQIESELNSREADLESLEAQQRSLTNETSMATITLSLVTAPKHKRIVPPAKPKKHRGGFLGGLQRGWDGFAATAVWVAAAVGVLLPFLIVLLVVALGARLLWPRIPHRHRPTPAPSE